MASGHVGLQGYAQSMYLRGFPSYHASNASLMELPSTTISFHVLSVSV